MKETSRFYRTGRSEQILDLWSQGVQSEEIREQLGLKSRGHVTRVVMDARDIQDPRAVRRRARRRVAA